MRQFFAIIITLLLIVLIFLTLKRNKEEIAAEAALAERDVQKIPVRIKVLQKESRQPSLNVNGIFQAGNEVKLAALVQGKILRIYKKEGARVQKGDLILKIDDQILQNELKIAEANFAQAKKDLTRFNELANQNAVTPQQLEQAELKHTQADAQVKTLKQRIADTRVTAPISGIVNTIFTEQGSVVTPGMPLAEIIEVKSLKMVVHLTESEVLQVHEGMTVHVTIDAMPGVTISGILDRISDKADRTLKYEATITVDNAEASIKAGMFGMARFQKPPINAIYIEKDVIVGDLSEPSVYIINDTHAVVRQIKTGISIDDMIEVKSGLKEGDRLIIEGMNMLKEGDEVKIIN